MPEESTTQQTTSTQQSTTDASQQQSDETIINPEGLKSALDKYKKLGSLEQIERMQLQAKQFEALSGAVTEEGFDVSSLPTLISQMKANDEKDQELEERYKAQMQIKDSEHAQVISQKDKTILDLKSELTDKNQADLIAPYFNANAKPEAVKEWSKFWPEIKPYVVFDADDQGRQTVKGVLDPSGQPMWVNETGKDARPGTVTDLFDGMIENKYGFILGAAMKPVSAAMGGGSINPATNLADGVVRVGAETNVGSLTPVQQQAIRERRYIIK